MQLRKKIQNHAKKKSIIRIMTEFYIRIKIN
jgi:hypothetical protein